MSSWHFRTQQTRVRGTERLVVCPLASRPPGSRDAGNSFSVSCGTRFRGSWKLLPPSLLLSRTVADVEDFVGIVLLLFGRQDDDTAGHLQKILAQIGSFCLVTIGTFVLLEIPVLYPAYLHLQVQLPSLRGFGYRPPQRRNYHDSQLIVSCHQ